MTSDSLHSFSRRTAALMIRLENQQKHNRPAYRWLADAHRRAAYGVQPSKAAWVELKRLEGVL